MLLHLIPDIESYVRYRRRFTVAVYLVRGAGNLNACTVHVLSPFQCYVYFVGQVTNFFQISQVFLRHFRKLGP